MNGTDYQSSMPQLQIIQNRIGIMYQRISQSLLRQRGMHMPAKTATKAEGVTCKTIIPKLGTERQTTTPTTFPQ